MSMPNPREQRQPKVRFRARTVSWTLVPLLFVGIAVWFAYNLVVCMGSGRAEVWQLKLCRRFNLLPDIVGLLIVAALVWLGFALRDLARATGGERVMAGRSRLVRPAIGARHAYRRLDADEKAVLRFVVDMTCWAAAISLATLVYYWFELAFPLALLVIGGVLTALVRLARRGVGGLGKHPKSAPRGPDPDGVLPLNVFHVLEEEYVAFHGALPREHPGWDFVAGQIRDAAFIAGDLANAAAGRSTATPFARHVRGLLGPEWNEARLAGLGREEIAALLKGLLSRPDLYDRWAVSLTELRPETQEYVRVYFDVTSEGLVGKDLRRFNRLLIEDAYPTALSRHHAAARRGSSYQLCRTRLRRSSSQKNCRSPLSSINAADASYHFQLSPRIQPNVILLFSRSGDTHQIPMRMRL